MKRTPLDAAWSEAEEAGAPESARLRFYALLLETRLCAPIEEEAVQDAPIRPMVFALSEGDFALGFDDDARMAGFFEAPVAYVALPGGALIAALAEAGLGLGLNLGDAPSATLLAPETVRWIAEEAAGETAQATLHGAVEISPPIGAPEGLLAALAGKAAELPGLVAEAWLVRLGPADAEARPLSVLFRAAPAAARAVEGLAAALGRAAQPFAPDGETVSVGALDEGAALLAAARAQGVGLHPAPREDAPAKPAAPKGPPILR